MLAGVEVLCRELEKGLPQHPLSGGRGSKHADLGSIHVPRIPGTHCLRARNQRWILLPEARDLHLMG